MKGKVKGLFDNMLQQEGIERVEKTRCCDGGREMCSSPVSLLNTIQHLEKDHRLGSCDSVRQDVEQNRKLLNNPLRIITAWMK